MKSDAAFLSGIEQDLPAMPGWIKQSTAETLEEIAFLSGAALAHLQLIVASPKVPQSLWRARLALDAAEACLRIAGRPERAADLRDALCLLRPGDRPGPGGEVYWHWSRAAERPISVAALGRALPKLEPGQIALMLDGGQGGPVARAAGVIEAVMTDAPRAEVAALILADAALAKALGWSHVVPLLALGLKARDLRTTGDDLRLACHRAVIHAVRPAVQGAATLARSALRLHQAAPRLRAKAAGLAIEMILMHDAVAPSALARVMSDRAARRLCDRLVQLGCLRELTGRDSFRLYGL